MPERTRPQLGLERQLIRLVVLKPLVTTNTQLCELSNNDKAIVDSRVITLFSVHLRFTTNSGRDHSPSKVGVYVASDHVSGESTSTFSLCGPRTMSA